MEENEVLVLLALHVLADGTGRENTRNQVGASGSLRKLSKSYRHLHRPAAFLFIAGHSFSRVH